MKDYLFIQLRELPYFRAALRAVEASFYEGLPLPGPVLDVGCGDGHFAARTFDRPLDVGLDPWHGPIHEAKRYGIYRLLAEADGARAPFPSGHFAGAVSNSVLEHIPHIDAVLAETARVLRPGAPFYMCMPNDRYLTELSISRVLGPRYTAWFRRVTRTVHADPPQVWQARLERAGFRLERWWHYFSPRALRMLEWGHYFGLPSLVARKLTGRWILAPTRWNLWLTEHYVRRFIEFAPDPQGTYTFYVARKS